MTQTLLFYEREDDPPTPFDAIEEALAAEGCELGGAPGAAYRPFHRLDPETGVACAGDLGPPPIEEDHLHPPRTYPGFRSVELALHIPLAVPHWHCVEIGAFVERLVDRLPRLLVLDTERTRRGEDGEEGPGPLDRVALLASWEQLHVAHTAGRSDCWRMERHRSIALWRYRRERADGRRAHPDHAWPAALALLDGESARSACLWLDPAQPLALPPVELLVVRRGEHGAGVLPADELLVAARGGRPLGIGGAVAIEPTATVRDLHARAQLMPSERFRSLGDQEWCD